MHRYFRYRFWRKVTVVKIFKYLIGLCILLAFVNLLRWNGSREAIPDEHVKKREANYRLVSAFSSNHFLEALRGCESITKLKETKDLKPGFMITYLLGNVSASQIEKYQKYCPFVELRVFPFEDYPDYVRNLKEYRWKALVVQKVFSEHDYVFWFDSSVYFNSWTYPWVRAETIESLMKEQRTLFSKCGIRYFGYAGHTIYVTTNPLMYKYFNFSMEIAKHTEQMEATWFTLMKTENSTKMIQRWADCALEEECMVPPNSTLYCSDYNATRPVCHRYDQSALSLLVGECSTNLDEYYKESSLVSLLKYISFWSTWYWKAFFI